MFRRLNRIREEFGTLLFLRTLLLLVVAIGMAVIGYFGLETIWPALIVVVGFVVGWLLRKLIVNSFEKLAAVIPAAFIVYGIVLFVGEKLLGFSRAAQVMVIVTVTVIVFEIQFWSLSDPSIVNSERADN